MADLLLIKPSKQLQNQLKKLSCKNKSNDPNEYILTSEDYEFLNSLNEDVEEIKKFDDLKTYDVEKISDGCLRINDLKNLTQDLNDNDYISLHDLVRDSTICVPENKKVERNPELEKRCQKLQRDQENRMYKNMTKNVDTMRVHHPEDTIAYQIKQFNKQLIAVFQFVVSVITGFVFGFMGIELMVGTLDFGFRLLLGIMCALIIALAELYFLAKQLNEIT